MTDRPDDGPGSGGKGRGRGRRRAEPTGPTPAVPDLVPDLGADPADTGTTDPTPSTGSIPSAGSTPAAGPPSKRAVKKATITSTPSLPGAGSGPARAGAARPGDRARAAATRPTSTPRPAAGAARSPAGTDDRRTLSAARLPALVAIVLLVVGAIVIDRTVEPPLPVVTAGELAAAMPTAAPAGAGSSTWYCAAGSATGAVSAGSTTTTTTSTTTTSTTTTTTTPAGSTPATATPSPAPVGDPVVAEQTVIVTNAGEQAQHARVTAYPAGGATVSRSIDLPARSRYDLKVSDLVQSPSAAVLVETDGGMVAVDHRLEGATGTAEAPCSSSPSSTWYFPTGSTVLGSREVFAVFNPFPQQVVLDFTFQASNEDGTQSVRDPQSLQGYVVPANSVVQVDITPVVNVREQIATTIRARGGVGRVVVDRIQIDDGAHQRPEQLSVGPGAPEAMPGWAFADGRRWSGTATSFVVYNPGQDEAEVVLATRVDNSIDEVEPFSANVLPGEYAVISLDEDQQIPSRASYWAAVQSRNGTPIVVERVVTPAAAASGGSEGAGGATASGSTTTTAAGSGTEGATPDASDEPDEQTKADPLYQVETAARAVTLGSPVSARSWIVPVGGRDQVAAALVAVTSVADRPVTVTISAVADGQAAALPAFDHVALEPGRRTALRVDETLPFEASRRLLLVEADGPIVVDQTLVNETPSPSISTHAAVPVRDTLVALPADLVTRASSADTVPPAAPGPAGSEPTGSDEPGSTSTSGAPGATTTSTAGAGAAGGSTTTTAAATTTTAAATTTAATGGAGG